MTINWREKPPVRSDPEKHKQQVLAANRARYKAVQLLIANHQLEFDKLYEQEASLVGVVPKRSRTAERDEIQRKIAELQAQLARFQVKAGSNGHG